MPHINKIRTRPIFILGLAIAFAGLMSLRAVPSQSVISPCATPGFTTPTNFAVGPQPFSVAVGDFNGDGKSDLATANRGTYTSPAGDSQGISVLLGTGAGGFGTATHFPIGGIYQHPEPYSVAVGDFNHDGKTDIVTANRTAGDVAVFLNAGGGDFQDSKNFSVGEAPRSVAVGDFNGDGNLDLATTNLSSPGVSVLLGDGTGSFGAATNITVGNNPNSVATGDFNGDGKDDLAVTDSVTYNLSIMLSTGSSNFGTATNYSVEYPWYVKVSDLNGDGNSDLAVAQISGGVSILLGTGTGSFSAATNFSTFSSPYSVTVGDFNGDNKADLATVDGSDYNLSILLGTGTGGFGAPSKFVLPVGSSPRSIATGDFNGDGKSDLATANSGSNSVSVLLSTCISSDTTPPVLTVPSTITVTANSPAGAVVTYSVSATDNLDPNPAVSCTPQSGSTFPIGSTNVNCTATDASGNSASDSFNVIVANAPPPPCTPVPTPTPDISLDHLQRSVALGPIVRGGGPPPTQEELNQNPSNLLFGYNPDPCATPDPSSTPSSNIEILKRSRTRWVRLWVDWPTLQPSPPSDPNNPFATIETDPLTAPFIINLDAQIKTARKEGFGVILTTYRFPLWANNYPVDPSGNPLPDPLDRTPNFRVPTELGVGSHWGKWIKFLIERYGFTKSKVDTNNQGSQDYLRYIDFLEVVNEPNQQMWPQQNQNGLVMPGRVARMFKTAQVKLNERNAGLILGGMLNQNETTLKLAGPAVIDVGGSACTSHEKKVGCQDERTCTTYGRFIKELLRELRAIPFKADENFAWSHHNYRDIECDRKKKPPKVVNGELTGPEYPQTNSAAWVRQLLVVGVDKGRNRYQWDGWPRKNHPKILITEGGARLNGVSAKYDIPFSNLTRLKDTQAKLVKHNVNRMHTGRLSPGIALVNNYLTYTDPCSDSGLYDFKDSCTIWNTRICTTSVPCTNKNPNGGIMPRPLYQTWTSLPPFQ